MEPDRVRKIVSGGQSGVDRAALDAALSLGIPCGGWCPRDRYAEDGRIGERYPLAETPSGNTAQRTEWNVRDSDGTLVLTRGDPSGGTALTIRLARALGRPVLIVDLEGAADPEGVRAWIRENRIEILNVAGPRESRCPGIHGEASAFLRTVLGSREDSGTGSAWPKGAGREPGADGRVGRKIVITGPPGCGKTTVVRNVAQILGGAAAGFFTEEVRDAGGMRTGFRIVTLCGKRGVLARKSSRRGPRVGSYVVDVEAFERVALPSLDAGDGRVLVIDEIGKMECHSAAFVRTVADLFASRRPLLATIPVRGGGAAIGEIRSRPDVETILVTRENRDALPARLAAILSASDR